MDPYLYWICCTLQSIVSKPHVLKSLMCHCSQNKCVEGKSCIDFGDSVILVDHAILINCILNKKIWSPGTAALPIHGELIGGYLCLHPLSTKSVNYYKDRSKSKVSLLEVKRIRLTRKTSSSCFSKGIRSGKRASSSIHHLSTISVMAMTNASCRSSSSR